MAIQSVHPGISTTNVRNQPIHYTTMADAATPAKTKKASQPKKAVEHPKYVEMVRQAIEALKERSGSSRIAILKYIKANFKGLGNDASVNAHLKAALKAGVKNDSLKQTKGTGASGSFRIGKVEKPKVAKKPKVAEKTKAKTTPKKPKAKKTAKKTPKKTATKAKTAKKAKTPKQSAAKKTPKKAPAKKAPAKKAAAKKTAAKKPSKKPAKK